MFSSAARHGPILACLTCCVGNHHTSHGHGATAAHPRASPLYPQAGSSGIFLTGVGCFSCQLCIVPPRCANTQSIFAETTKQHRLLSFLLFSFLLLFLGITEGLDAWGLSPPFCGAAAWQCWAETFLAPTSRGQSRLLLVSHLFAFLPSGYAELELLLLGAASLHVCLRPVPKACFLPSRVGRGSRSCFSSPCQVWKEFLAC